jgi:hypothetical protein
LKESSYPFPDITLRFLGIIVQKSRIIRGKETAALETWMQRIEQDIAKKMIPVLRQNNMMFPEQLYRENGIYKNYTLTKIPNFNSLIALSQEHQAPVYALTPEQLRSAKWQGNILEKAQEKQKQLFESTFSDLADKIIGLTSPSYAVSA